MTWFIYVPTRSAENLRLGREHRIWGVKDEASIKEMRTGDEVVFVHDFKNISDVPSRGFPRVGLDAFEVEASRVIRARVTSEPFVEETRIWDNGVYPHRFRFEETAVNDGVRFTKGSASDEDRDAIRRSSLIQGAPIKGSVGIFDWEEIEDRLRLLQQAPPKEVPVGKTAPAVRVSSSTQFARDPRVAFWVLQQANGSCELCDSRAPFHRDDGRPYLEVHHVKTLAEGGSDTVSNATALCPNCHRRLHYSNDRSEARTALMRKVPRLSS